MRRHERGRGRGARGQGATHSLLPGGAGIRPGTLRPPEELADGAKQSKTASRQKRGPDAGKTSRWSAAGRSVLRQRTRTPFQGVNEMWRLAALHPLGILPGEKSLPPRRRGGRRPARGLKQYGRRTASARRHPHLKSSPTIGNSAKIRSVRALLCGNLFGMVRALSKVEVKRPTKAAILDVSGRRAGAFPPPALFKSRLRQP